MTNTKFSPSDIRQRRLLRLAQIIFDHFEEGSGMDTRYFEHPFIHDGYTVKGVSENGGSYREHVVPRVFLRDEALRMYREGESVQAVAEFLDKNLWIAKITNEEAEHLDHGLKLKNGMTPGWNRGDDPLARLVAAGIRLIPPSA